MITDFELDMTQIVGEEVTLKRLVYRGNENISISSTVREETITVHVPRMVLQKFIDMIKDCY